MIQIWKGCQMQVFGYAVCCERLSNGEATPLSIHPNTW